jgi:tRNA pseudouridine55 synthase
LCADIGQALGVGGHLYTLERRRVGPILIEHALTINQIAHHLHANTLESRLMSLDELLFELPAVVVNAEQARRVLHGSPVSPVGIGQLPSSPYPVSVRLKNEAGQLLAIGTHDAVSLGAIKVRKVLSLSSH